MNEVIDEYIEAHSEELLQLGDELFHNPELGFREFRTVEIIRKFLAAHHLKIERETSITGFTVSIGEGKPHIGLIAELDAIPTRGHPCADPVTTAAHACGHSTQVAIMLGVMAALNDRTDLPNGKVTLYFTPAEEFTDMEYRKSLAAEGRIRYCSGKQNMLAEGVFEDADCLIHIHAMANPDYRLSIGSVLSGFVYKKITFLGRASHAAALPDQGINALHACTLFINAVNMLRESFRDQDVVRVHGIIQNGGNTVNSIPDKVVYECYVRAADPDVVIDVNHKVSCAAEHCAKAIGADVRIEDTPGYLPLHQDEKLNETAYANMLRYVKPEEILHGEISAAAGDVGDLSMFRPLIQIGYGGFSGRIHGADLMIKDPQEIYLLQAKIVGAIVLDLLNHPEKAEAIRQSFVPKMTMEEYLCYLNGRK
ncbi:MAG: amidohydrolase [Solobacterium sp.]|nr:amidohydrolase [Solobacterium sp.]